MNTYLGYIRVSTPRQGEGVSLEAQQAAIQAYARTHDLHISGWFEEKESAAKQGRQVFNQVLTELEKGRASGVIIHKVDRSARHLKDWAWLGDLIDRGVDVRFAHENLDLASRGGRLTADLLAVLAADYSRNLRDEVRKGLYGRLKQGVYPFRAPIGYLDQGAGRVKAIDPVRGPLVRQAFELYATRRFTLETLQLELERRGLRRDCGKPLSRNGVHKLLNNSFYAGLIHIKASDQTFAGGHAPLVSMELFERTQAVLTGRTNTRSIAHDFIFRRMLTCAACGHSLTGERQKNTVYYRCHSRSCPGVSLSEPVIIGQLRNFLALISFDPQELQDLRDFVEEDKRDAQPSIEVERARVARAVGHCDERLSRLTDAVIDGLIDKETFDAKKAALLRERRLHLDQLENQPDGTPAERLVKKFELGNAAYLGLSSEIADEIRDAVEKTTSNLSVDRKDLVITPRFPYYDIAKQRLVTLGGAYRDSLRTTSQICLSDKYVERSHSDPVVLLHKVQRAYLEGDKIVSPQDLLNSDTAELDSNCLRQ